MNVDEAPLYRRTRNHVSYVNLEQPGIYRSNHKKINYITFISQLYITFLYMGWAHGRR